MELPGIYRSLLDSILKGQRAPFPYTVLIPTLKGIQHRGEIEKLVCMTGESLHVLEQQDHALAVTSYPLHGRCFVEQGVLLLFSWITVHGPTAEAGIRSTCLRFNSVTDHVMRPFVEQLRAPISSDAAVDLRSERARFEYLAPSHYKFFSHGRASIRPGAKVLQLIMQPEIRVERLRLFGYPVAKQRFPAHLSILTDSELIHIRDDETQFWLKRSPHGAIWSYIPRSMIEGVSLGRRDKDLLVLQIDVGSGSTLTATFDASAEAKLQSLRRQALT
jgi:hypothetical protein